MDNRSVELQAEYQNRFESSDSYRDAVWKILCNDFFSKYIPKTSVLLDLGGWMGWVFQKYQGCQEV